jgi:hypothetical protein
MMLEFAGFHVAYNRLLRLLGTSDYGTPHSRIKRLSRIHANVLVTHKKGEIQDIISYLENGVPVAIFVYTGELPYWSRGTGHAVVVVGYSGDDFYLNDPAYSDAPHRATYGDVALAWEAYNYSLAVIQRKS